MLRLLHRAQPGGKARARTASQGTRPRVCTSVTSVHVNLLAVYDEVLGTGFEMLLVH